MKRNRWWWVGIGVLALLTLWYFGGQLDKEQKVKDNKPIDKVELPVEITTPTSILGGPQAQCEMAFPGQHVQPVVSPSGPILCTPVSAP